jgi:hypothetical protein
VLERGGATLVLAGVTDYSAGYFERSHRSDPEAALVRLEQHRREFPNGALAPEREVMRVEVLCALGRAPAASCVGTGSDKSGD